MEALLIRTAKSARAGAQPHIPGARALFGGCNLAIRDRPLNGRDAANYAGCTRVANAPASRGPVCPRHWPNRAPQTSQPLQGGWGGRSLCRGGGKSVVHVRGPRVSGRTGASGIPGASDTPGPAAVPGPTGIPGPAGVPGPADTPGLPDASGPPGPSGSPGPPGALRPPGSSGAPGISGSSDAPGSSGPIRATRPSGPTGSPGTAVAPGAPGTAGASDEEWPCCALPGGSFRRPPFSPEFSPASPLGPLSGCRTGDRNEYPTGDRTEYRTRDRTEYRTGFSPGLPSAPTPRETTRPSGLPPAASRGEPQ